MGCALRRSEWGRWLIALGVLLAAGTGCASDARLGETAIEPTPAAVCLAVYVLYSPSCVQCRYIKPAAERLAAELAGQVSVSLVPADEALGRTLRQRYAIRCLPAVQIVNASGSAAARAQCGFPTYEGLLRAVHEALRACGCSLEKGEDTG
ncbi:MAG: hypothetical protein K6V36_02435 [Anaerolineae bacterium]|nr:hypothetical protein [Anaerolineae bacterium]